jgi:hypothetical protein
MMIKRNVSIGLAALLFSFATAMSADAETLRDRLSGTWTLVLADNVNPDGSRIHLYGPIPRAS